MLVVEGAEVGVDCLEHAHPDESDAEIPDAGEEAVKLGLVLDQPGQGGCPVAFLSEGDPSLVSGIRGFVLARLGFCAVALWTRVVRRSA